MTIRTWRRLVASLIFALVSGNLLGVSQAQAQPTYLEGTDTAAVLFDPMQVSDIELNMSTSDFNSLKYPNVTWDNEGDWLETTMVATVAGKRYGPYRVGVHLKGAWGSWRDVTDKAAFKIKMDAFVPHQKLLGITKLTLNNMVQDSSYIHEMMTYRLLRELGVPAPRVGYTEVNLNGIDYGLHLNVETINKEMLKRWGITSQHLYKGSLPFFPDFLPGSESAYRIESGDLTETNDLTNFIAVNQLDGEDWWNAMSQTADMEKLTLGWAVELFSGHWDGYVGNKNNYYLNFDKEGQATLLIWGTDQTWGGALNYFDAGTVLPTKCRESQNCRELYLQSLARVASTARKINLTGMVRDVREVIGKHIASDPFGAGLKNAIRNQDWSTTFQEYRSGELTQMVIPWDTTVAAVRVNGKSFSTYRTIYLEPQTKTASIVIQPSQMDIPTIRVTKKLKPGLNEYSASITSLDSYHSNAYVSEIYVLTQRSQNIFLSYLPTASTLGPVSIKKIQVLKNQLKGAQNLTATLAISKNSPNELANLRVAKFLQQLKDFGIEDKFQVIRSSSITRNNISLTVRYQN